MHESDNSPVFTPPIPRCRKSLPRSKDREDSFSLNNNFQSSPMEEQNSRRQNTSNLSENEELSRNRSTSYDPQMTESSSEEDEEVKSSPNCSQNRSRTISPERYVYLNKSKPKEIIKSPKKQNTNNIQHTATEYNCYYFFIPMILIVISFFILFSNKNKVQTQSIDNPISLLSESIENIKATFHNQESDIWNDISSAINEVISRSPKKPSIILLFATETTTMDCLAIKLARASETILHADDYLTFNPKNFGNDAGEIIATLKEYPPEQKKVVVIRDILNINAEAIKALHNLCDRINPLIEEAIYILTMQTDDYQPSQKKLNFVENQIYNKLSKSIDQDVLMALVTRITDGAIILVQSEPHLRYC